MNDFYRPNLVKADKLSPFDFFKGFLGVGDKYFLLGSKIFIGDFGWFNVLHHVD